MYNFISRRCPPLSVCLLFIAIQVEIVSSQRQPEPGEYPSLTSIPKTSFDCKKRPIGYYADPDPATNCQVYHMCDMNGKKFSYLCPNGTLFHQQHLICAHWYQVNCTRSESLYNINSQMFPFAHGGRAHFNASLHGDQLTSHNGRHFTTEIPATPAPPSHAQTNRHVQETATNVPAEFRFQNTPANPVPAFPTANQQQEQPIENGIPAAEVEQITNGVSVADDELLRNSVAHVSPPQAINRFAPPSQGTSAFGAQLRTPTVNPAFHFASRPPPPQTPNAIRRSLWQTNSNQLPGVMSFLQVADSDKLEPKFTMKFPKRNRSRHLSANSKCPHCNPYFIKNELLCFPCVSIR